jgi:hypothetical protein
MGVQFQDTDASLVSALKRTADAIQGESITIRELLELVGEQGLLLFCGILTLPFLIPVSIPGVSTVFGIIIILIGVGVTLNRVPWLPQRLMSRSIAREHLVPALEQGEKVFARLERWIKPRMKNMTTGLVINRVNGLALTLGGILLIFPLGLIPFSNTLPAIAILLLAMGMLQRDGYFIVAGYVALVATIIYFAALALLLVLGGQTLLL